MELKRKLKVLLGMDPDEADLALDEKLDLIIESVRARLKLRLDGIEPPVEMDHIIVEVSAIRFNRIGSEGMSSHQVEGEAVQYAGDEFTQFRPEIDAFLRGRQDRKGTVRII